DLIVMMSHLGMYDDETLANRFPTLFRSLSSHTHHHFEKGERVNGVLLAAAGRYGEYIGEVTLTFENGRLTAKKAAFIESDILSQVENDYYDIGKAKLKNTVIKEADRKST